MFWYGDRVVCVDDSPGITSGGNDLVYGQTYVVEAIGRDKSNEQTLILVGIPKYEKQGQRIGWSYRRFIPKEGSSAILDASRIKSSIT